MYLSCVIGCEGIDTGVDPSCVIGCEGIDTGHKDLVLLTSLCNESIQCY